jgi:aspartyl-tRNA(Asn)/glutamyl-tRNA(Gln) amidotransferase subunit A
VRDAALVLDVIAGGDDRDRHSLPAEAGSYVEACDDSIKGMNVAWSTDLGYAVVQSDVAAAVEEGVRVFEKLGHRVEWVKGGPPQLGREWGLLSSFELASRLYPFLPEHEASFGRAFLAGVKTGWEMTPEWWGQAARLRARLNDWCAEIFERYDLLVTPTVPYDPPPAKGPPPEETEGRKQVVVGSASFTIPFNLSWHPAATVRAGRAPAGLPVGLQIVGPRHRDDLVLQAAWAFEQARPWAGEWPEV